MELRQGPNGTPPPPVCLASVRTDDGPVQLARVAVQGVVAANRGAPAQLMDAFERFKDLAVMDAEGFTKDFVKGGQVSGRLRGPTLRRPWLRSGFRALTVADRKKLVDRIPGLSKTCRVRLSVPKAAQFPRRKDTCPSSEIVQETCTFTSRLCKMPSTQAYHTNPLSFCSAAQNNSKKHS